MDESYPIPAAHQQQVATYARNRVVALRSALTQRLGPQNFAVALKREPSASEEQKRAIRYTLTVRKGSVSGANIDLFLLDQDELDASSSEEATEKPRQRLWVATRAAGRLTDRIDRLVLKLGCVVLLLILIVGMSVAIAPGGMADPWGRFFEWLAVVVLSYAVLLAIVVPVPKRLLGLLQRNRELLAVIRKVTDSVLAADTEESADASASEGEEEAERSSSTPP